MSEHEESSAYVDSVSRVIAGFEREIEEIDAAIARLQGKKKGLHDVIEALAVRMEAVSEGEALPPASEGNEAAKKRGPPATQVVRSHLARAPERWFTARELREESELPASNVASALRSLIDRELVERQPIDPLRMKNALEHWEYRTKEGREKEGPRIRPVPLIEGRVASGGG